MKPADLSGEELGAARQWWNTLPDRQKGQLSIWTILAMYAKHVLDTQTVHFDADKVTAEVGTCDLLSVPHGKRLVEPRCRNWKKI